MSTGHKVRCQPTPTARNSGISELDKFFFSGPKIPEFFKQKFRKITRPFCSKMSWVHGPLVFNYFSNCTTSEPVTELQLPNQPLKQIYQQLL